MSIRAYLVTRLDEAFLSTPNESPIWYDNIIVMIAMRHKHFTHILKQIRGDIVLHSDTKTLDIIKFVQQNHGLSIKPTLARSIRQHLLGNSTMSQQAEYGLIPAYLRQVNEHDPGAITNLVVADEYFKSVFIMFSACINLYANGRKFIALDGTHCVSAFKHTLLLAATFDSNDKLIILAWGLVISESTESWNWFLSHLRRGLPTANSYDSVFISDRDKGLLRAVQEQFPLAHQAYCVYHLSKNVQQHASTKAAAVRSIFWAAARAQMEGDYLRAMELMRTTSASAHAYILEIPGGPSRWATYAFPGRRFGHITSNLAECANAALKTRRRLPALHLLHSIYQYIAQHFAKRTEQAASWGVLVPAAERRFTEACLVGRSYSVVQVGDRRALVTQPGGKQRGVHLPYASRAGRCECREYQLQMIPCRHACAAAVHYQTDCSALVHPMYTTASYRKGYDYALPLLTLNDLEQSNVRAPLETRDGPGRPKVERGKPGEGAKRTASVETCVECGSGEHVVANCNQESSRLLDSIQLDFNVRISCAPDPLVGNEHTRPAIVFSRPLILPSM
ncbi:MAG: transposase [Janthinobacterium lividum]